MTINIELPWKQEVVIHHTQRLLHSFQHWTGDSLLDASGSLEELKLKYQQKCIYSNFLLKAIHMYGRIVYRKNPHASNRHEVI